MAASGTPATTVPGRSLAFSLLVSLRPGQWTKNLLVFAGLLFAQTLFDPASVADATAAFVIFCALSGVVYLVNDIVDRETDRRHPLKCAAADRRPAHCPVPVAACAAAVLSPAVGLAAAFAHQHGVRRSSRRLPRAAGCSTRRPLKHIVIHRRADDRHRIRPARRRRARSRSTSRSATGCSSARFCWRCSSRWQSAGTNWCCSPTAPPAIGRFSASTARISSIR